MKILFVVKKREIYDYCPGYNTSFQSGLFNSARMICEALKPLGFETHIADVVDNNCIDREISLFKPDICIIEGLWVVPTKFSILTTLHPAVQFVIRIHSRLPFLAVEGQAIDWIIKYAYYPNVYVACNNLDTNDSVGLINDRNLYLPNYYLLPKVKQKKINLHREDIHIGCFGAVRPMKNQLTQAFAAIKYAEYLGKKLYFHMNSSRVETGGGQCIKNIRALFSGRHELVEHEWLSHAAFLRVIGQMDINLAVSCTESFCIVAADSISQGVPVIASSHVEWVSSAFHADTNSADSIFRAMMDVYSLKSRVIQWAGGTSYKRLVRHSVMALEQWEDVLRILY
jgi:hypothetical protein